MAKGFRRGEIVIGYCSLEHKKGPGNYLMRTWRMMHAAEWLGRAVRRRPYRGMLQNFGFTKQLYFGANGFTHLNMNIGEDDLFLQKVMTRDNVSVILSPRATLREKTWGGLGWGVSQLRYFGSAFRYYPRGARNYVQWEIGSRMLFFLAALCALAVMPPEYRIVTAVLMLVRYLVVVLQVRRIANRLGERGISWCYWLYDLLSMPGALLLSCIQLRKDERVWR